MFYAENENGVRIGAFEADKNQKYICPICRKKVALKKGHVNLAHFAHETKCDDNWNYDMSEWHKRMQDSFPKQSQEVVVEYMGKKHRADVLINDIVLEFQFSPITAAEFDERNYFFQNAGYRLAWIFNISQHKDNILPHKRNDKMRVWKYPMRIFTNINTLSETNNKFALWFSFGGDDEFKRDGEEYLQRVIWAIKEENLYSFKKFIINERSLVINGICEIDPKHFFFSEKDYFNESLSKLQKEFRFRYEVKHKGKSGLSKNNYICPKRSNKFGIDLSGETGCYYCKHCYMITENETATNNYEYASYCCYPIKVRDTFKDAQEYECSEVEIFKLKKWR